jgi:hypothetical protein
MTTYHTLREANIARQKEWDAANVLGSSFKSIELSGEIGEALEAALLVIALGVAGGRAANIIKKLEREKAGLRGSRATLADLAKELADIEICNDLLAMDYEINMDEEVSKKFNEVSIRLGMETMLEIK